MIHRLLAAGAIAVAAVSFAPVANAGGVDKDGGFYATPIQKGAPRDLPGERAIPGVVPLVDVVDGVTRPILVDPIQAAGAGIVLPGLEPAPAVAASGPVRHHRHHHHHHVHVHHHHHHH